MVDIELVKSLALGSGSELKLEEPLSRHTGFRTGGPAAAMLFPASEEGLTSVVAELKKAGERFFILGNGSNVVAQDEGYDGVVVSTKHVSTPVSIEGETLFCAAGTRLSELCEAAAGAALAGVEFAYGIPGTVGGAVYMNAGAYGGELRDVVSAVRALTPEGIVCDIKGADCGFGYRTSVFQNGGYAILSATFMLHKGDGAAIRERMSELMGRRRDKQPLTLPSCGSTFRRPEGAYAGALIERCGLRGFSIGGAGVSEKHCGFVVNNGTATTADIRAVIDSVRETVLAETGYDLKCEVEFMER